MTLPVNTLLRPTNTVFVGSGVFAGLEMELYISLLVILFDDDKP
jgi:hypothetical protein